MRTKIKSEYLSALNKCTNNLSNYLTAANGYVVFGLEEPKKADYWLCKTRDTLHCVTTEMHHLQELHKALILRKPYK